jgi:RNA polymerase sigma factor (sigma-70 family)
VPRKDPSKPAGEAPRNDRAEAPELADSSADVRRITESVAHRSPGYQHAWRRLAEAYREPLLRHARRKIGPTVGRNLDPEDAVNDAMGRAFQSLDKFVYKGSGSFLNWLKELVNRIVLDAARKGARRNEPLREADLLSSAKAGDPSAKTSGPLSKAATADVRRVLEEALETLAKPYREVLAAYFFEELSQHEIAARFGRKPNTVTHQIKRGLVAWRAAVDSRHGAGASERWFGRA